MSVRSWEITKKLIWKNHAERVKELIEERLKQSALVYQPALHVHSVEALDREAPYGLLRGFN